MFVDLFGTRHTAVKAHTSGTHRARAPRETLATLRRVMPRFGITRLANVTGLDVIGVPVFTAIRPNARSLATSQGKGLDPDAARVSALMESIELWHAEHLALPLRRESYVVLAAEARVADPESLPRRLHAPFVPEAARLWATAWDIVARREVYVPHELVCLDQTDLHGHWTFEASSNGLSSGNDVLEAIVHGICEVVERDAEALWRANGTLTRVDLSTIDDPDCRELLRRLDAAGVHAAVWDITSDLGIPTYACGIMDSPQSRGFRQLGFFNGFGCHLDPAIALLRALTEAVQVRLTYVAGNRDDLFRRMYRNVADETEQRAIWDELTRPTSQVRFARHSRATGTFEDDVQVLIEALKTGGLEQILVADLSRPQLGIAVVKVIVPGAEGFGRTRPGRRRQQAHTGGGGAVP